MNSAESADQEQYHCCVEQPFPSCHSAINEDHAAEHYHWDRQAEQDEWGRSSVEDIRRLPSPVRKSSKSEDGRNGCLLCSTEPHAFAEVDLEEIAAVWATDDAQRVGELGKGPP